MTLNELVEDVQGKGTLYEVSALYTLCEHLENINRALILERSNMTKTHASNIQRLEDVITEFKVNKEQWCYFERHKQLDHVCL